MKAENEKRKLGAGLHNSCIQDASGIGGQQPIYLLLGLITCVAGVWLIAFLSIVHNLCGCLMRGLFI